MKPVPRGIRNNNPLNIRKSSSNWQHKVNNGSDTQFEQFDSIVWGIRAAFVLIRNYIQFFSDNGQVASVESIVSRWAPPSENNTKAYIAAIQACSHSILKPDTIIDFSRKYQVVLLVWCMAAVECGEKLPCARFYEAYDLV